MRYTRLINRKGDKMIRKTLLAMLLVIAVCVSLLPVPALAADPTVTITVSATVVAVTNSQATWIIGNVEPDDTKYFSADNDQDDDYAQLNNTGNVAIDIEVQCTDIEGGDYDWTLANTTASETYNLTANSDEATTYDINLTSAGYPDLKADLAVDAVWNWSMVFVAPSAFHAADDGVNKSATVTLVASQHV